MERTFGGVASVGFTEVMENFLRGISVTCFVGSYVVALALELTRSLFRVPGRGL